jgi:hypothetical protein
MAGLGQLARREQRAGLWAIFVTLELYLGDHPQLG